MVYKWLKNNLFKGLAHQCLLCLGPTHTRQLICTSCENDLPANNQHCIICSKPLQSDSGQLVCGQCQKSPPAYISSHIPHIYSAPVKQLITQLKFHNNLSYASLLADNFANHLRQRNATLPECIIPVPLHPQRLRERGFNQALELARIVAKQLNIPLKNSLCKRSKATPYQSGLSAKQRKQNLKNAFKVTNEDHYQHVAIFDDVVTTGTTVNELAKELKKSGIEVIEVWAIARTDSKT